MVVLSERRNECDLMVYSSGQWVVLQGSRKMFFGIVHQRSLGVVENPVLDRRRFSLGRHRMIGLEHILRGACQPSQRNVPFLIQCDQSQAVFRDVPCSQSLPQFTVGRMGLGTRQKLLSGKIDLCLRRSFDGGR